jgi:hypothetical protein
MFANKLKKVSTIYLDNMAIQTSIQHYKDLLKNLGEQANKSVIKEEEKQFNESRKKNSSVNGQQQPRSTSN